MSELVTSAELLHRLNEPILESLAAETMRNYLDWDELTRRTLPPGFSLAETWELLGKLRRFNSTTFPIETRDGRSLWYTLDREAQRCLGFIRRYARSESRLHSMLQEREGHRFLVRSRIQEAIATCQLDGVIVDFAKAGKMLQEGRHPQTDAERLVYNSYLMLTELDSFGDEKFTTELVHAVYERVTHGVNLSNVPRGLRRTNLAGTRDVDSMRAEAQDRDILQAICDYANGKTGDCTEPAAIKGYMILSAMAFWHPLPDLNDTVARHLLRMYAVKRDYPVLGYLPTSLMMLEWFNGTLPADVVRFSSLDRRAVVPGSIDGTKDILTHLQLTTAALAELLGYIEVARQEEADLQAILDSTEDLNYRQRSVLGRALSHPGAEFQIRQHQTSHRVVYQTARTDLLDLVQRGYLEQELRGKAFIFVPAPGLKERLGGDGLS